MKDTLPRLIFSFLGDPIHATVVLSTRVRGVVLGVALALALALRVRRGLRLPFLSSRHGISSSKQRR